MVISQAGLSRNPRGHCHVFAASRRHRFCLLNFSLASSGTDARYGLITISGSEQGPIYPCGNTSCPTYDSGQITITVNGFNAVTNYSHTVGQKTSHKLANSMAAKLNATTSPVIVVVVDLKISISSKLEGRIS